MCKVENYNFINLFYKPDFDQKSSPIETSKKEYELTTIDATFYDSMRFSEKSDYFSSDSSFDSVLSCESNYFENLSSDSTSDIGIGTKGRVVKKRKAS